MLYHAKSITIEIQDANAPALWHALAAAKLQEYEVNHTPITVNGLKESPWREALDSVGERSIRVSVRAYKDDGEACAAITKAALNRDALTARFTLPDTTHIMGKFVVQRLQLGGEASGLEELVARFESSGEVMFSAS